MILKKITHGIVVQSFDTEKDKFIKQEFIAGDHVSYETEDTTQLSYQEFVDRCVTEPYLPFEMKQPNV